MGALFGKGSKSTSQNSSKSWNEAYPTINSALSPVVNTVGSSQNMLSSLLGLSDGAAGQAGFQNYKRNAGFDFALDRGQGATVANAAARGMLNSGATQKGLASFTTGLQSQYYNDYVKNLLGFGAQGISAAGVLTSAGQRSESQGTALEKGGKPGLLGLGAAIASSDRRLKENIEQIGHLSNGLPVYVYNYIGDPTDRVGVMAQEVAEYQPEALGPTDENGFMTVNYSVLLGDWEEYV